MKIQIVDDGDNLIGYKEIDAVDDQKDIYRVSALWVTNSKGEVLIAQRKLTKDKDPGKWGPAVAGTVEEGETYESNIRKESEEEIGLGGVDFKLGPKQRVYSPHNHFTQWFLVKLDWDIDGFRKQDGEVERLAWIPSRDLAQDIKDNPEKYVPSMPWIVELLLQ